MTTPTRRAVLPLTPMLGLVLGLLGGCDDPSVRETGPIEHEEAQDLEPVDGGKFDGALQIFDPSLVWDDAVFVDTQRVDAAGIQALLEATPYERRSFLADEQIDGTPFAEVLVTVARAKQLNPMLLLVRLQVEQSLVSKTDRPATDAVDFALGCGCADGQSCNAAYRGLDKQLECAAGTLRTHYDASVAGTGAWRPGVANETLDPQAVTPKSNATAALYAYTPWVLEDTGGNWLVWNVSRRYIGAMIEAGTWDAEPMMPEVPGMPAGSCVDHCDSDSAVQTGGGHACFCDPACEANGDCCADFGQVCRGDDEPEDPPPGLCDGACDSSAPKEVGDGTQCYCDDLCVANGDCCSGWATTCG